MRVIFRDIDPMPEAKKRIIKRILERDIDHFWLVEYNEQWNGHFFIEFYKGLESDFNIHNGSLGADYYATIDCEKHNPIPFELSEHYIPIEGSDDRQIHVLGVYNKLGIAVSNMMRKGNSTDGRKPTKIIK